MAVATRSNKIELEIWEALRKKGCSVQPLCMLGTDLPDLLIGYRGANWLISIKGGKNLPSNYQFSEDKISWCKNWRGEIFVISTVQEALDIVNRLSQD